MKINIKVDDSKFQKLIKEKKERVEKKLREAIVKALILLQGDMRLSIRRKSQGRVYIKKGGQIHIASKEGDPPNTDTGLLINSILRKMISGKQGKVFVANVANYAKFLEREEGTRHMKPRPFFKPAIKRNRKKILAMINKSISDAIK